MSSLLDQIPGLREAVEQEQFSRDESLLQLPEAVCGVAFRPLTLSDVVRLRAVGSPFIVGGWKYDTEQTLRFFTMQCTPRNSWLMRLMRRQLLRRVELDEASEAAQDFVSESYAEAPSSDSGPAGISYYSPVISAVDLLAKEYGWKIDEVMNLPLKILFQIYKAISHRNGAVLFNPSDSVRGAWLAEQNKQRN